MLDSASDVAVLPADTAAIKYSRGFGKFDNTPRQLESSTWTEFAQAILSDSQQMKGQGWIAAPMEIAADDDFHRTESKQKAVGQAHRCAQCALPRQWIGLDIDKSMSAQTWERLKLWAGALQSVWYETASSVPQAPRARLILLLDQAATRDELAKASKAVQARICKDVAQIVFDQHLNRPEQPLFLPLFGAKHGVGEGPALCLRELLNELTSPDSVADHKHRSSGTSTGTPKLGTSSQPRAAYLKIHGCGGITPADRALAARAERDLWALTALRGGVVAEGMRLNFLFWILNYKMLGGHVEPSQIKPEAIKVASWLNPGFKLGADWSIENLEPVRARAAETISGVRVLVAGRLKVTLYTPKSETLIQIFKITDEEQAARTAQGDKVLKFIMSPAVAKQRRQQRNERARRAAGALPLGEAIAQRCERARERSLVLEQRREDASYQKFSNRLEMQILAGIESMNNLQIAAYLYCSRRTVAQELAGYRQRCFQPGLAGVQNDESARASF